jgi:hypothetical protein
MLPVSSFYFDTSFPKLGDGLSLSSPFLKENAFNKFNFFLEHNREIGKREIWTYRQKERNRQRDGEKERG